MLTAVLWITPVYAQRSKQAPPTGPPSSRPPVGEYALVVILLALPIGLICRSSRRF
jgi:hypothetical protein